MAWRPHGHAHVDPDSPSAWGRCDRCGFIWNLKDLTWQYQFAGTGMVNLRLLVCEACLDVPQPQLQALILPPDPEPVFNARPEPYLLDEVDLLSTEDQEPITTQDETEIVPNDPSQNFSESPPDPNNGPNPPNSGS